VIPIHLKLNNFMAYREADLDFQGINLAVLTGENGAGKSSLLDAITWSLWGKARARRDDELIYLGQSDMEVEFTFNLAPNIYRIIRKRDASKRGRSNLSFQVQEAGGWRTLTDTSLRTTQQKINNLLRLDYDTFINSAFLLQGRADEFTTKTPGKRKEILGDILGLGIYDLYVERAKRRANQKDKEATAISAKIEQIEQDLAREPEYREQLTVAQEEANTLNRQLQLAEKEMELLREQHRSINEKQRQLDALLERVRQTEQDLAEMSETIEQARTNINNYQTTLDRRADIEAGWQQLQNAREANQDWEERFHQSTQLADRKHQLDTALNAARTDIEANLRELSATINLLSPKADALESTRSQLKDTQTELDTLKTIEQQKQADQAAVVELDTEAARLGEQNNRLKLEMQEIKTNLDQLAQADSKCPVCQRPLDEHHQTEVLAQFEKEGKAKGDTYRRNQDRVEKIKMERATLQQKINEADRKLRQQATVQGRSAQLAQSLKEAEAAVTQLKQAKVRRQEWQTQLDNQDYAPDIVATLAEVEAELAGLGYDRAAHQQMRQKVESLTHFETEKHQLATAEKYIKEEEKRLQRETARHTRLLEQTAADRQTIEQLTVATAELPQISRQLNQAGDELNRLQREERFAREQMIAVQQQLAHIAYQAKKRAELETELEEVRNSLGLFRELQTAFGKKGVQALLIENAIPEIEDEANKLLSRMTASRMHVRFETQRAAKSSDNTIETLDIRISDELGTRDYELYSGGEAFRVNFAIRIAMSKVLARRAGASLQTLVIDEGFGTQDGQGRERLVEAINTIQDDFEKIIVITHIDELKEAFPARIEVWKTPDGSQVSVR